MHRAPEFWKRRNLLSRSLLPFAFFFRWLTRYRLGRSSQKADVPVICVGNIVVGGAGKTPSAIFLARQLQDMGERCFILSRGFGGSVSGACRVDASRHDAREVGDEALMMSAYAPVIVSKDRVVGARLAIEEGARVIVMDDGFQNPFLHKDFSFLVIDGGYGLGNGYVLPAGPLRELPQDALARADALIVIDDVIGDSNFSLPQNSLPNFPAAIRPRQKGAFPQPLIAFAGIGRPEKFFALLEEDGARLIERYCFPDHHVFRKKDAIFLLNRADARGAHLMTTEKDIARLSAEAEAGPLARLRKICHSLPVELVIYNKERIKAILKEVCRKK